MTNTLLTLNEYIWIVDFAVLCVLIALAQKNKYFSSSLITVIVVTLMSGIILQYRTLIFAIDEPTARQVTALTWSGVFIIFDCILVFGFYKQYQKFKANYSQPILSALFIVALVAFLIYVAFIQFGPIYFNTAGHTYKEWVRVAYYFGFTAIDGVVIYAIHQAHRAGKVQYSSVARMYLLAYMVSASLHVMRFLERAIWDTDYLAGIYRWGFVSINLATTTVVLLVTGLACYQLYSNKNRDGALWHI